MTDTEKRNDLESPTPAAGGLKEQISDGTFSDVKIDEETNEKVEVELNVTEDDLLEAKELAATFSLDEVKDIMTNIHKLHRKDPNFPLRIIEKIEDFLHNDAVFSHPEKHEPLIAEMKIEAALITNNSPYSEVRSVVDNHDDPSMPCSTIRVWFMGIIFSAGIAFINGFFEIRQPAITVTSNVPQLLAYPVGKFLEKVLPDVGVTLFGVRHSLNPGPFNKKEHMMIAIMASIAKSTPYTNYLIWMQYLPTFLNQSWAISFGYQILLALSTNFIGYGLAGLCRRFLVYPSFCVWPASLVTIALNAAFHSDTNVQALGPFGKVWRWSRLKFFVIMFTFMFFYFWLPNSLFMALSYFSWMTWIDPNNPTLDFITGSQAGLGFNPLPTFDWNMITFFIDPLMVPFFTTFNLFAGSLLAFITISGMYFTNALHTGYFPINTNVPYDRFALPYDVSQVLDKDYILDEDLYQQYSPPYLAAGQVTLYMAYFSVYSATAAYAILFHRQEIMLGLRDLINSFRPSKREEVDKGRVLDVHNRLMREYKEVPEWWYMICLVIACLLGCLAIGLWPTNTNVGVVFFGVALCLVFVVPCGIIMAMTGVEVSLNVLAEFIGGSWVEGNALAMCYFKTYGYITCSHALHFSQDLKLAHYLKIPPRMTFAAQMVPTIISTFVCVSVVQYQIHLPDVCTENAPFRFTCPGVNSYFTSAIMWGTVGPKKLWGVGGQYAVTLVGFPVGAAFVIAYWFISNKFPKSNALRSLHPVVFFYGGVAWAPYNLTYLWPAVPVAAVSWLWLKVRYISLWSKYNYVLSAAFSCGIALSAVIQFFGLAYNNVEINWWGNTVITEGCEAGTCVRLALAEGQAFGPTPGNFN